MSETNPTHTERGLAMRKLLGGLLAVMSIILVISSSASAQEAVTEDPNQPANTVDCVLLNFTPPEQRTESGNFAVDEPITLELYVAKGGAMYYYFVAAKDGAEPYRLNDGMDNNIIWTPTEAGTYVIHGEFESTKTGETVEVEDPSTCEVTLIVEDAPLVPRQSVSPEPGTCAHPDTPLTAVPEADGSTSYYAPDGTLCGTILAEQPFTAAPPAPPAPAPVFTADATDVHELPRTGSGIVILAIAGVSLLLLGLMVIDASKRVRISRMY